METLESVLTGLAGKFAPSLIERAEKVSKILGAHVVAEAQRMAKEIAEETGASEASVFECALWGAMRVQEFRDPAHVEPVKFYSCRICWDTGFQVTQDEPGKSSSRACLACQRGLVLLAGDWLSVLRPMGRHGKRFDSNEGRDRFNAEFRHLPTVKEKLLAAIQYLEQREGAKG